MEYRLSDPLGLIKVVAGANKGARLDVVTGSFGTLDLNNKGLNLQEGGQTCLTAQIELLDTHYKTYNWAHVTIILNVGWWGGFVCFQPLPATERTISGSTSLLSQPAAVQTNKWSPSLEPNAPRRGH